VLLGPAGQGSFGALVTDEVTVSFPTSVDPLSNASRAVGLAELEFAELGDLARPSLDADAVFTRPCGEGPSITIDDQVVETSLTGTVRDLLEARPLRLEGCGDPVTLDAGRHEIDAPAVDLFDPSRLVLRDPAATDGPATAATPRRVQAGRWGAVDRSAVVAPGDEVYLAVTENFNAGWRATLAGEELEAVRLDGWRQGWVIPEGRGGVVTMTFAPDRAYQGALAVGAGFVLALFLLAFVGRRRGADRVSPATDGRTLPPLLVLTVAVGVCFVLGGPLALFVPLLLLLPARDETLPLLAAAAYLIAGVLVATNAGPGGNAFGAATQILAVQAVAAVLVSLIPPTWPPLPWLRRPTDGGPPPGPTDRTEPAPGG
jgi:arabinofuranan 3-O-arabinosyltransferase